MPDEGPQSADDGAVEASRTEAAVRLKDPSRPAGTRDQSLFREAAVSKISEIPLKYKQVAAQLVLAAAFPCIQSDLSACSLKVPLKLRN